MPLPPFTPEGFLPAGDYELSLAELRESYLVTGPPDRTEHWDAGWRSRLVDNLEIVAGQLWQVGARAIYVDGSFVENRDHPNDIDGYFECDIHRWASGEIQRELNLLDPHKVWTWDPAARKPYKGHPKAELPMWHHYHMDLYPHYGQFSGVQTAAGKPLTFPDLFRQAKYTNHPRGIVKLTRN